MKKIPKHPILHIVETEKVFFKYNGKLIEGEKGYTIAAALHQAGFPVHSHSLQYRNRSLECGIGKCGACEMLVDNEVKRICITKVDNVKEVNEIPKDHFPSIKNAKHDEPFKGYHTSVVIIGAGPAGLATREILNQHNVANIVIDNNKEIGGQFNMQTHQFFFFEKEKKYGGMRGFEISKLLAGDNLDGIFLNSTVWDILENKRIAVKNIDTDEMYFVDCEHIVVATGAIPFMPSFENDDLPGVYTAAVVQKMMNVEHTLLGKSVLTIGAGNIGYLVSYQLMQAGANVKAIIEAQSHEGGFPVQANRVRRLGIPIMLSHILIKAIPNEDNTGINGAVIAECENFKPIPGTEKLIEDIDVINICTGLVPDNQLLTKGNEIFGRQCYGVGDSIRIGEGTSAVLRGKQAAYEILENIGAKYNYDDFLNTSKEYIESQQHPSKVIEEPHKPDTTRQNKPFVLIDCLYGFACNPCAFACPHGAITKISTSSVPHIDFSKCIGCMQCVYQCPGLAIFGYDITNSVLFLPTEFFVEEKTEVFLVNNQGKKIGNGIIERILKKSNQTNVARVRAYDLSNEALMEARGFIPQNIYPQPLNFKPITNKKDAKNYICHCEDITLEEILDIIGDRKFISIEEIKHTTRLGMGACRGKRCIKRLKQTIAGKGIEIIGDATPRAPLSNQISLGEMYPKNIKDNVIPFTLNKNIKQIKVPVLIAGGGIGGSALFRYFALAGMQPTLINYDRGASWRNISGGRSAFSVPELSDIATHNLEIFKKLQEVRNIDFKPIRYISFAHDEATYQNLESSTAWSDAYMIENKDFNKHISPWFNKKTSIYQAALITNKCWQASPGKVVDLLRSIGIEQGGSIREDCKMIDISKEDSLYHILCVTHEKEYIKFITPHFVNALGPNADIFAKKLGLETSLYPVKHQAFITRRLPLIGKDGDALDMLIDRRNYKGFSAVYGQQLKETGQIIGCASPLIDAMETGKNLKVNSKDFLEIISEVFVDWIPHLSSVGFQAVWSGYYVEPRYIIDPNHGLFIGLRGHGFMLAQYLAKLYVDSLLGKELPEYFQKLSLNQEGISEIAFK